MSAIRADTMVEYRGEKTPLEFDIPGKVPKIVEKKEGSRAEWSRGD